MENYCLTCAEHYPMTDSAEHCHVLPEKKVIKVTKAQVTAAKVIMEINESLGRPSKPAIVAIANARKKGSDITPVICRDCKNESLYDPCHWCMELRNIKRTIAERDQERERQRVANLYTKFNWAVFRYNTLAATMALSPLIALGWFWFACGLYEGITLTAAWSLYHMWRNQDEVHKAKKNDPSVMWIIDDDETPGSQALTAWMFMTLPLVFFIIGWIGW